MFTLAGSAADAVTRPARGKPVADPSDEADQEQPEVSEGAVDAPGDRELMAAMPDSVRARARAAIMRAA